MWMKTRNNNKCHEHADTTYQSKLEDSSPTKEDKDSDQETNITSSRHKEDNEDNIQGSKSEEWNKSVRKTEINSEPQNSSLAKLLKRTKLLQILKEADPEQETESEPEPCPTLPEKKTKVYYWKDEDVDDSVIVSSSEDQARL